MTTDNEQMRAALERVTHNFRLAVAGKPVRDMAETLAEVEAALSAPARRVEAVALTPDQRKAIKQFMKMGEDSLNLAHSGYFSEGGWAYEQLASLAAPKE